MKNWFEHKHSLFTRIISGVLVLSFILIPISHKLQVNRAEAIYCSNCSTIFTDVQSWVTAGASIASKVYDGITSAAANSLAVKDITLDGIAWALINTMIQQMSKSIITWINSGFKGSPAFVTNLGAFLLDVVDVTAGRFLTDLGLSSMCAPFKLNIQLALAFQYQGGRQYQPECRLSQVVGNMENFFKGDLINNGGWDSWLAMTTIPSNNPYGALVEAQSAFELSLTNAKGEQVKLLDFGRGFKSMLDFEVCDEDGGEMCSITTRGAVIEDQLNNTLDSGRQRLIVADEINEVLSALFAQLVQQAFSGVGGLLGLSGGKYKATGFSYIEAAAIPGGLPGEEIGGLTQRSNTPISDAITAELGYIAIQREVVALIGSLDTYELSNYGNNTCSTMPTHLESASTTAGAAVKSSTLVVTDLRALEARYLAEVDPTKQYAILQEFYTLQSTGRLHMQVQTELIRFQTIGNEYTGLIQQVNAYRPQIDDDCRRVEASSGGGGSVDNGAD